MINFNQTFLTGEEISNIEKSIMANDFSGDGRFTASCKQWLTINLVVKHALLTHSATAALEMAVLLSNINAGDEVILPSYTFVSTANCFVLRGAIPVFVDIRPDTLNLDENKIEEVISSKTKAIIPVHYAGVACNMDEILKIKEKHNLIVIEDAAQGILSKYKNKYLGTIGDYGALAHFMPLKISAVERGGLFFQIYRAILKKRRLLEKKEQIAVNF